MRVVEFNGSVYVWLLRSLSSYARINTSQNDNYAETWRVQDFWATVKMFSLLEALTAFDLHFPQCIAQRCNNLLHSKSQTSTICSFPPTWYLHTRAHTPICAAMSVLSGEHAEHICSYAQTTAVHLTPVSKAECGEEGPDSRFWMWSPKRNDLKQHLHGGTQEIHIRQLRRTKWLPLSPSW